MFFESYARLDNVEVANRATFFIRQYKPARLFIDAGGVGGGVVDILNDRGFRRVVRPIMFGGKALADDRYHNRRAEMWDELRIWLSGEQRVQLPNDENLANELCAVNKKYDSRGRLQLEEKEEIKKRLGKSPDMADALALTFAEPVFERLDEECGRLPSDSLESMFRANSSADNKW